MAGVAHQGGLVGDGSYSTLVICFRLPYRLLRTIVHPIWMHEVLIIVGVLYPSRVYIAMLHQERVLFGGTLFLFLLLGTQTRTSGHEMAISSSLQVPEPQNDVGLNYTPTGSVRTCL